MDSVRCAEGGFRVDGDRLTAVGTFKKAIPFGGMRIPVGPRRHPLATGWTANKGGEIPDEDRDKTRTAEGHHPDRPGRTNRAQENNHSQ